MKLIYLTITFLLGLSAGNLTTRYAVGYPEEFGGAAISQQQHPLAEAEDEIARSTSRAFMRRSIVPLREMRSGLESLLEGRNARRATYWLARTDFQMAIFYLTAKDMAACQRVTERGIGLLEELDGKNTEEYALLAYLQGFSVQFSKGLGAAKVAKGAKRNATAALQLDDKNPRAYYVLGSLDFYTPKRYGGGKKVEDLLTKSLALPANRTKNPYLPDWGRAEAYELLVRYYVREDRMDDARTLLVQGLEEFPDDYQLNALVARE
ncbi:MAG: hypothetical protein AAFZ52_17020 [Bacteroidota bacterium]